MKTPTSLEAADAQASRHGLLRIVHAAKYSWAGLRLGWQEAAFRQELFASLVLIPLALYVGRNWPERAILLACWMLVMVVELLNTAVEKTINRIGPEWHVLSKAAKDLGSAAVLLALLLWGVVWGMAIWSRYFG